MIVPQPQQHSPITTWGLSNQPDLTFVGLEEILSPRCRLKSPYLSVNPILAKKDGDKLLGRFEIHHSDHLRKRILHEPGDSTFASLLMGVPVTEIVWVGVPTAKTKDPSNNGKSNWNILKPDDSGLDLGSFCDTKCTRYMKLPLQMTFRPARMITSFLRLLQWAALSFLPNGLESGAGAGLPLALASSRKIVPGVEVACLDRLIYSHASRAHPYDSVQILRPGH